MVRKKELLTQGEYAKRRSVSRQAISQAVKKGHIPTQGGLIDPVKADKALRENLSPKAEMTFAEARTQHEQYKAALAKLDYEERSGTLHATDSCRKTAFSEGRKIRDAMLNIPDRISSILAAELDEMRVNAALKQEIRAALNEYATQ